MVPEVLDRLPAELEERWTGGTKVQGAKLTTEEDSSGDLAVFVTVMLSDAPRGQDTWPVEDVWMLRRLVQESVDEIAPDLATPWFLRLVAEHPETFEAEDEPVEVNYGA